LWVEKVHEFCGNPHFHFLEIRSCVRIILRRRFGKPQSCGSGTNVPYNDLANGQL
jgi:hypothetical protein